MQNSIQLEQQIEKLIKIAISLTSEHNLEKLLNNIVTEARSFTNSDAGSLYIKEGNELVFMISQNDTIKNRDGVEAEKSAYKKFTLPINKKNLAGYVAFTGDILNIPDAYNIPDNVEYSHKKDFDKQYNYRTVSMLIIPMKDNEGKITGVLQLINSTENGKPVPFKREFENLILSMASQAAVAINNAKLTDGIKKAHYNTIIRLAVAAEYKDEDTALHIKRMSEYSAVIAKGVGLSESEVETIKFASPMHDIGKIGIPDRILLKPGKLDAEEWEVMKSHTTIGGDILKNPDSDIIEISRKIALSHHEKYNGKGYPLGTGGEEIPLEGRIVALADVFDALSSKRPYKDPWPLEKIINLIKEERGQQFDPKIVDTFFEKYENIMEIYNEFKDE
ncbi:MAG: HD domain-containing protein [bacterium]|nr:HD domain-containing protein [bacterium]